ncbi:helix-turn-helix transcriptional regulator [Massilia antarctica]|uniref:Helix-turn-helix transcriptional regulator n=1 Tax=Massilia antarctica TaxID=2765360 RepID=A0AA48WG16_9BURK|nr:helix-turn-helix transcriptional regulator [Massilia antarctica]QPI50939.1 helix-turn-helix transcriptional regulator [Massilia antarctica]
MDKDISTLLREIKDASGWTEMRMATALGTTQPTVSRILNGQADCKIATFHAICALHALKCPPARASGPLT